MSEPISKATSSSSLSRWSTALVVGGALAATAAAAFIFRSISNGNDIDGNRSHGQDRNRIAEVLPTVSVEEFQKLVASSSSAVVEPVLDPLLVKPIKDEKDKENRLVLLPQFLDIPSLIHKIRGDRKSFWQRDIGPLSSIYVDFGRSHYFLTIGSDEIPVKVHKYVYANFEPGSPDERAGFFEDIGVDPQLAISAAAEVSPRRNALVTRVKFELLSQWVEKFGSRSKDDAEKLALVGLNIANQHVLRAIKQRALQAFDELSNGRLGPVHFSFFKLNYVFEESTKGDRYLTMQLSFINYAPDSGQGIWQMQKAVTHEDSLRLRAEFKMNLEQLQNASDLGVLTLHCDGRHEDYMKKRSEAEQRASWGLYNSTSRTVIRFADTAPTW